MIRFVLAGALLAAAVLLVISTITGDPDARVPDLLVNLGTEIVGIALTVAIVDWLIERNKLRDESLRLAWRMLHQLDHVVWVWQGGRREFHLDELVALLDLAEREDPIPDFTRDLMINLGIQSSDTLRLQPRVLRVNKRLRTAMDALKPLNRLSDLKGVATPNFVVDCMRRAALALAEVTGQRVHRGAFGVARTFRDPRAEAQERRYRGSQHESIKRELGAASARERDDDDEVRTHTFAPPPPPTPPVVEPEPLDTDEPPPPES